jgi:hypothetical protein
MNCNITDVAICNATDTTEITLSYTNTEIGSIVTTTSGRVSNGFYIIENYVVQTIDGVIVASKKCSNNPVTQEVHNLLFGGDTFIGRFSFKRKHSFFNRNTFKLPNDTDFNYSLVPNVGYPSFFFDTVAKQKDYTISALNGQTFPVVFPTKKVIDNLVKIWKNSFLNTDLIQVPNYKFDCFDTVQDINNVANKSNFIMNPISGITYTYYYGIPSFIVESDINVDLRDNGTSLEEHYYPKESNLDTWLQEKNVPIKTDNFYKYDFSYSKQAKDMFHYMYDISFKGDKDCKTTFTQRVIYTSQSETIANSSSSDNFLVNKALDYYDFSKTGGKLISIESLESDAVLVRQENVSNIFKAYIEINTSQDTALISTGTIFKSKPVQFANPTLGYFGSQHKAILHTPFGHISVDAKRGNVFILANGGQGLEEISNQGLKHWFKENLPFTISKTFKNVDIDNTYNGIGISLCYDKRFNSFYLTKLDYEPKSEDIRYNEIVKRFYLQSTGIFIDLHDKKYFKDKAWTISFNFYTKSWTSWHSFTPNYYIEHVDHFDSGNDAGLWKHNVTNKSYQVFYNKLYPFIVEVTQKPEIVNKVVTDVNYFLDVFRYYNDFDYYSEQDISFNKAIVYNRDENSGLLELEQVKNNLQRKLSLPIKLADRSIVEVVLKEHMHSINQFRNIVKPDYLRLPHWLNDTNNVNKQLNVQALGYLNNKINNDYIRNGSLKIRLINDKYSNYKLIFKGILTNGTTSRR